MRLVCYRCHKPQALCVCGDIPRVMNRTPIIILQHPRERFHPIGTVRFAELGLARAELIVRDPDTSRQLEARVSAAPERFGLLFPAANGRALSALSPKERPEHLLVLDGTWSQAKGLYRQERWLRALPHYFLTPTKESSYRIRSEPTEQSVSTIEAIIQALEILEPELTGLPELLLAFERMIDRQIEYTKLGAARPKKKRRKAAKLVVPEVLRSERERLVLVYGEFAPLEGRSGRELVYWAALRPLTGQRFERFVRPPGLSERFPTDRHLTYMGLDRAAIEAGGTLEELGRDFAAFLGPSDTLAAWNQSTFDFYEAALGRAEPQPRVVIKELYSNLRRLGRTTGALGEVMEREGIAPSVADFPGRVGRVLGQVLGLLERLPQLHGFTQPLK